MNIANSLDDFTTEFFTSKWVKILEYSIQFSAYALNKASICSIKSKWNLQLRYLLRYWNEKVTTVFDRYRLFVLSWRGFRFNHILFQMGYQRKIGSVICFSCIILVVLHYSCDLCYMSSTSSLNLFTLVRECILTLELLLVSLDPFWCSSIYASLFHSRKRPDFHPSWDSKTRCSISPRSPCNRNRIRCQEL